MLILAESLPNYVVFNGPKCGASHPIISFASRFKMPILLSGETNFARVCCRNDSRKDVEDRFEDVYRYLQRLQPQEEEPMMI